MTPPAHDWPARTGQRLRASALMLLGSAALLVPAHADPLVQVQVQVRAWAAACTGCHNGSDGAEAATGMKALAGTDRDDLRGKLLDFKAGRLPATVMPQLTRGYEDAELRAIADYFSRQAP